MIISTIASQHNERLSAAPRSSWAAAAEDQQQQRWVSSHSSHSSRQLACTRPQQPAANSTRCSAATGTADAGKSRWLAANPSKRWAEVFFLGYSPFWITWALCVLVPFQLYEVGSAGRHRVHWQHAARGDVRSTCAQPAARSQLVCALTLRLHCCACIASQYLDELGYLLVGLAAAVPCLVLPLALPNKVGRPRVGAACVACSACCTALQSACKQMTDVCSAVLCCMLPCWLQADEGKPWYTWFWVKVRRQAAVTAGVAAQCSQQQSQKCSAAMTSHRMHAGSSSRCSGSCSSAKQHCTANLLTPNLTRAHSVHAPAAWPALCRQANLWVAIFGFIGNYFWTHYFFNLLGAAYTLPSYMLNGVRGAEPAAALHAADAFS